MALSKSELFTSFSSFPDDSHVRDICKPGKGATTCRYLIRRTSPSGNRYLCEKAGTYRKLIDEDVQRGVVIERGNNCRGILGFVDVNQDSLCGLTTLSQALISGDRVKRSEGKFDALIIDDGHVTIGCILEVPEEDVELAIDSQGITFIKLDEPDGGKKAYRKETVLFENPLR